MSRQASCSMIDPELHLNARHTLTPFSSTYIVSLTAIYLQPTATDSHQQPQLHRRFHPLNQHNGLHRFRRDTQRLRQIGQHHPSMHCAWPLPAHSNQDSHHPQVQLDAPCCQAKIISLLFGRWSVRLCRSKGWQNRDNDDHRRPPPYHRRSSENLITG